jgi:hypothetical protein
VTNLIIEMPDDLARSLEGIAASQHKTVQQLAVERLRSLVVENPKPRPGSAAAVLQVMLEPPHPSASEVEELDRAILAGRRPAEARDLFSD